MFRSRSSDRKLRDPDAPEAKWETTLDYRRGYGYVDRWGEVQKALEPLIHQLRAYDALRRKLEEEGGRAEDLTAISELLNEKITIEGAYRDSEASLTDQAGLRAALRDVGAGDVHLDLRQLDTRMPVYCRGVEGHRQVG